MNIATIRSSLSLYDGMTGPLQNIHRALGMVLDCFEAVRDTAGNAVDSAAMQNTREELTAAGRQVDAVAQSLQNAGLLQAMLNKSVREGVGAWGELAASADRLDSPDGWNVNNTLEVQTADALGGLEWFAETAGRLDGSTVRAALLLDGENLAFDRKISTALSLDMAGAVGKYETFTEFIRDGVPENDMLLNTTEAADRYGNFAEVVRDGVLKNTLLLNTAGAVGKYETLAKIVQDGVLRNALLLNTAGAVDNYETFAEAVRDSTLENALLLNTVGAVDNYESFSEDVRDGVLENVLRLDTVGAVDNYEAFARAIRDNVWENILLLSTAGTVGNYGTFAETVRDGVLENILLLSTAGAMDNYETFAEAVRGGVLKNALTLDTADGLDAFSHFLGEMDGNSSAIHMDVDVPRTLAAFDSAADFVEAWSGLEPVLLGAVGALNLYSDAQMTANALGAASQGVLLGAAAAFADGTAAQYGFNNAIAACPVSWLAVSVNTLISVFHAVVEAVDAFAGESASAVGVVGGAFSLLGDYVASGFVVPFWNALASAANFIGNVFNDPVAAVKIRFFDMALTVVDYIRNMAGAIENVINKIPGVTVNITSGLDNFTSGLEQARQQAQENSGWVDYARKLERADYSAGMDNNVFRQPKMLGMADDLGIAPVVSFDFGNVPDGVYIAARTAETDALDYVDEDLAWMRNLAEREAVNQFTTAEITVEQHNENYISKDTDLDGIMDAWAYDFARRLDASGEGVHD